MGRITVVKHKIDNLTKKHTKIEAKPSRLDKLRLDKLEKRIERLDTLKWEMSEFVFQAVSLVVGIVAIIFAFLIGVPAYQKISDTTNTEIIREIGMLNNILIFLILVVSLNIVIQFFKWKRGRIDGKP